MKAILKVASFQTGLFLIWVFIALMTVPMFSIAGFVLALFSGSHVVALTNFLVTALSLLLSIYLLKADIFLIRYGLKEINRTIILMNVVCFMTFMGMFFALPRH
ncbi:hypothetical protein GC174_12275 [bacterium]|nr:hypothetical protein [bacterium]